MAAEIKISPITTTRINHDNIIYGLLYNWYAATDVRNITPVGWHIPTSIEFTTLRTLLGGSTIAGGKMKEIGTDHWSPSNTGATNESGFTAFGSGYRDSSWYGMFMAGPRDLGHSYAFFHIYNITISSRAYLLNHDATLTLNTTSWTSYKGNGQAIRCIRDSATGWTSDEKMIDYDGNIYDTVQIGTQIWTVQNLAVTHYRNGDVIPEVIDGAEWMIISDGGLCAYDNNWDNVFDK
jgi:uncharacterized protein (TIGR02145 family)